MVALSNRDKSRCRFHLGYGAGTPAGDRARLEYAMNNIDDNYWKAKVQNHLDRCDRAWDETESDRQDSGIDYRELIEGDINRTVVRYSSERLRVRIANYVQEGNMLAETLFVPNYRDPSQYGQRFYVEGSTFIKAVPGPADTSVGNRIYLARNFG